MRFFWILRFSTLVKYSKQKQKYTKKQKYPFIAYLTRGQSLMPINSGFSLGLMILSSGLSKGGGLTSACARLDQ